MQGVVMLSEGAKWQRIIRPFPIRGIEAFTHWGLAKDCAIAAADMQAYSSGISNQRIR